MISIKMVSAEDTYPIRNIVLRNNKGIEFCKFDGDHDKDTFHIGAFYENKHIGIASFCKNSSEKLSFSDKEHHFQLRGMAILNEMQGKSIGKHLLTFGLKLLKNKKATLIWCNAREVAVPFYLKLGFAIYENPFEIPEIGIHYCMYLEL